MKNYILYTAEEKTIGLDTEVDLTLYVTRESAPQYLSDFAGGRAKMYDGYTTYEYKFTIELFSADPRRLVLKGLEGATDFSMSPEFIRKIDPSDPFNQLQELPLKLNQNLSGFIVTNSNWGLT